MHLYELQTQLVSIDNILENNTDPETQQILESAKDEVLQAIDGKVENILNFISDCKGKAEQLKQEEDRLYKKRKSLENKTEYLKNLIYYVMKSNNLQKATYGTYDCTIAKSTPKIVIDDESLIPEQFIKTVVSIDKMALKKEMKDGAYFITIDGKDIILAHEESTESLRIK